MKKNSDPKNHYTMMKAYKKGQIKYKPRFDTFIFFLSHKCILFTLAWVIDNNSF